MRYPSLLRWRVNIQRPWLSCRSSPAVPGVKPTIWPSASRRADRAGRVMAYPVNIRREADSEALSARPVKEWRGKGIPAPAAMRVVDVSALASAPVRRVSTSKRVLHGLHSRQLRCSACSLITGFIRRQKMTANINSTVPTHIAPQKQASCAPLLSPGQKVHEAHPGTSLRPAPAQRYNQRRSPVAGQRQRSRISHGSRRLSNSAMSSEPSASSAESSATLSAS